MWIVPPLICAIGIVVAFLPPAEPIDDPPTENPLETSGTWVPMALGTIATLAVLAIALHAVLVA
jgi:hypothetical protein